jgi:hypothetical protein
MRATRRSTSTTATLAATTTAPSTPTPVDRIVVWIETLILTHSANALLM